MKSKIVYTIGQYFTQVWIQSQQNPKLEGFSDSAEYCLRNSRDLKVVAMITKLLIFVGLFGFITIPTFSTDGIIATGASFGLSFLFICSMRMFEQGETRKSLAKDWGPIRAELFKFKIIQRIILNMKKTSDIYFTVEDVREALVRSFDQSMKSLHQKLRKAEREGFPKKEGQLKKEMLQLQELVKKFGLEMDFREYGLGVYF